MGAFDFMMFWFIKEIIFLDIFIINISFRISLIDKIRHEKK